jgi:hypothetical protein
MGLFFIVGLAFLRYRAVLPEGGFAGGTLIVFLVIALMAMSLNRYSHRFDLTVAAETLVALGIFSLIVGLIAAIFKALALPQEFRITDLQDLRPLAAPFLEGLFTAAVAPFLAATLRNYEVITEGTPSSSDSKSDFTEAAKRFVAQVDASAKSITKLSDALEKNRNTISLALNSIESDRQNG